MDVGINIAFSCRVWTYYAHSLTQPDSLQFLKNRRSDLFQMTHPNPTQSVSETRPSPTRHNHPLPSQHTNSTCVFLVSESLFSVSVLLAASLLDNSVFRLSYKQLFVVRISRSSWMDPKQFVFSCTAAAA